MSELYPKYDRLLVYTVVLSDERLISKETTDDVTTDAFFSWSGKKPNEFNLISVFAANIEFKIKKIKK